MSIGSFDVTCVWGNGLLLFYFLPTNSIATSVQQKVLTWTVNSIATNTCSCSCPPDTFCFTSENTILRKWSPTVTVLQNHFPPATEMFKGSHTDTVLENDLLQTAKRFKFSDECQIRELAEAYNTRIPPTHECLFDRRKIIFPVRRQCAIANFLFIKDSVFAYTYMNTFCHRPHLLWNKSISSAKQSSGVLCLTLFWAYSRKYGS